nr:hypothetical protein [Tanacetum cinerariifolium]
MEFHERALLAESKRSSHKHKPELRLTKVFEAKYKKVKAKLALLSVGASTSKSSQVKNQGLITEAYEWDKEEVSSDDNKMVEVKVKITDSLVNVINSSITDYDSTEESSLVCSTSFPPLEKLVGAEPIFGPKIIKSILKSCSTIKIDTLKVVIINEPTHSPAPAKGNKNISISKKGSASASKLKNVKTKDDIPLSVVMKELNDLKFQINKNHTIHTTTDHNDIEWFKRGEALQAKKTKSSNANKSKTSTKRSSHKHKPELRLTKVFEAKYKKVKAKLALLSVGASTSKSSQVKNQGLITEAYEWDKEEVSSDDNKMVEVKVLMALANDESGTIGKKCQNW